MRTTILWFAGILTGVFIIFSLLDHTGDYSAEQIIWNANNKLSKIAKNTAVVPDQAFAPIIKAYEKVINSFPLARMRPMAYVYLGQAYIIKKDYAKAREVFGEISTNYPNDINLRSQALSNIGNSYEIQGNWAEALTIYKKLEKDAPYTDLGLGVPLYIANYYKRHAEEAMAEDMFKEAADYYKKTAKEHLNSEIEYKSLRLLSNCYLAEEKWVDAVGAMSQILLKYPSPAIAGPIIDTINNVVIAKIKDLNFAIAVYQDLIVKKPESPLNKMLTQKINAFKTLKEKNVKIIEAKK